VYMYVLIFFLFAFVTLLLGCVDCANSLLEVFKLFWITFLVFCFFFVDTLKMSGRLIISRHKSWHVWNQDNVDKVEKDERLLEEQKEEEAKRVKVAEGEARLLVLKRRAAKMRGEEEEVVVVDDVAIPASIAQEPHMNLFENGEIEEVLLGGARAVESGARQRRLGAHNETESKSTAPKATAEEQFGAVEKLVPW
jgi:hypothetical protein